MSGKTGIIYLASNNVSGKKYVGQTLTSLSSRRAKHHNSAFKYDSQLMFHQALRKHGKEAFTWDVIEDNIIVELLDDRETYWIERYDSFHHGYNMTLGGGSSRGYHHSDETKDKIRSKAKGKSNLDHYVNRYGEEEGKRKYEVYVSSLKERKGKSRLQCFVEKYGEEEGTKKHERFVQKMRDKKKGCKPSNTLEHFVELLGKEEGKKRYDEFVNKMKEKLIGKSRTIETKNKMKKSRARYFENKKGGT